MSAGPLSIKHVLVGSIAMTRNHVLSVKPCMAHVFEFTSVGVDPEG